MAAKKEAAPKPKFVRRNHGRGHSYRMLGPDGEYQKLDGVTTLLGNGKPNKGLVNWAAEQTANYAVDHWDELAQESISERLKALLGARYKTLETASKRGTEVHDFAEQVANGAEVEVPTELKGYVESAVAFLDEMQIETLLTETSVFNVDALYGGTFDLLLKSGLPEHKGKVILADWKTSAKQLYADTALQLTAYARATHYVAPDGEARLVKELGITDLWGVWIRSDGYDVYPLEYSLETWRTFGYIAGVARSAGDMDVMKAWKGDSIRPRSLA